MQRTWIGRHYNAFVFMGALGLPLACYTICSYALFASFGGLFQSDSEVDGLVALLCILLIFPGGYLGHKFWKILLKKFGTTEEIEVDNFLSKPIEMPTIKPIRHLKVSTLEYRKLVAQGPLLIERVCTIASVWLVWGGIICLPWILQVFSQATNVVLTGVLGVLGILLCLSVPSETLTIDQQQRTDVVYTKKVLWWTKETIFPVDVLEGVELKAFTEYRLGGKVKIRTLCVILKCSVDDLPDIGVFHTKAKEEYKAAAFLRRIEEHLSIPATTSL